MFSSCSHTNHPFDSRHVKANWWPPDLKCLVNGENPGSPASAYFYDPIPQNRRDPVRVRSALLNMLSQIGIIGSPDLAAFKAAGLVFDHAIRCPLASKTEIIRQRHLATSFGSPLAHQATYLRPLIEQANKIWVMGHIARDAVIFLMKKEDHDIRYKFAEKLSPPSIYSKFFFSRYLTRCPVRERNMIA